MIYLRDRNPGLCKAWDYYFKDKKDVNISCGDIFDLDWHKDKTIDALVSPANSFGFMNGGIDGVYTFHYGQKLQEDLQKHLVKIYNGILPVGQAVEIPIDSEKEPKIKFLISAPTMTVPMDVSQTINAFLAFKAILDLSKCYSFDFSILCPGLGTAIGKMPYMVCAKQMRAAYDIIIEGKKLQFYDLGDAYNWQIALYREI